MKAKLAVISLLALVVIALAASACVGFSFAALNGNQFLSGLGALLVFALLVERTMEVFFSIWLSEESYKRQAAVQRLVSSGTKADDPAMVQAQEALIKFRSDTQKWVLPSSLALGLLIASVGPRVMYPLVVIPSGLEGTIQLRIFHGLDIVLTGMLLAGGADPIHKFMDALRKFFEATAAKASGTRP